MVPPFNSKYRNSLMPVIVSVFLCLVTFPLAGQTQKKLDNDLYLLIHARGGDPDSIGDMRKLLEKGANPNGIYWRDMTFFMEMIYRGYLTRAELLLEFGADLFACDTKGRNAAYYINKRDGIKSGVPEFLLSKGIRFDITDNEGVSPCMYYMQEDSGLRSTAFFLDWEEKNSPDFTAGLKSRKDYLTALFSKLYTSNASEDNILKMAFRLFEAGADTALVFNSDNGRALFLDLIYKDKIEYLEALFKLGMSPDARDSNGVPFITYANNESGNMGFKVISMLVEKGATVNGVDKNGNTLLIRAAENGNSDLVKFLLNHGADPNIQNNYGATALINYNSVKYKEVVDILMANGADPNLQNKEGKTALMLLIYKNPMFSLRDGVDPTIKDLRGWDALFYYSANQPLTDSVLQHFLSRGCRINDQDIDGYTPLTLAARAGIEESILTLLDNGADPNIPGDGRYALHYYLLRLNMDASRTLAESGRGKKIDEIISAFLSAGAQPALKDNKGESALSYVFYLADKYPGMEIYRDQILKYTDADEIKTAKVDSNKKLSKEKRDNILYSDSFESVMKSLGASLLVGGLSVGMREGSYKGRDSENFMGSVNSVLTMSALGTVLGGLIGVGIDRDKGFSGVVDVFIWGGLGFIGGIIVGCQPSVQKAFKETAVLYYTPTAVLAAVATVFILKIWL